MMKSALLQDAERMRASGLVIDPSLTSLADECNTAIKKKKRTVLGSGSRCNGWH